MEGEALQFFRALPSLPLSLLTYVGGNCSSYIGTNSSSCGSSML